MHAAMIAFHHPFLRPVVGAGSGRLLALQPAFEQHIGQPDDGGDDEEADQVHGAILMEVGGKRQKAVAQVRWRVAAAGNACGYLHAASGRRS
jgi:hypothetical protein